MSVAWSTNDQMLRTALSDDLFYAILFSFFPHSCFKKCQLSAHFLHRKYIEFTLFVTCVCGGYVSVRACVCICACAYDEVVKTVIR